LYDKANQTLTSGKSPVAYRQETGTSATLKDVLGSRIVVPVDKFKQLGVGQWFSR
jgi:hypothetical protein